jgi:hypothetical protein
MVFQDGMEHDLQQGLEQTAARQTTIKIATELLDILDDATLAAKTGLTVTEVAFNIPDFCRVSRCSTQPTALISANATVAISSHTV